MLYTELTVRDNIRTREGRRVFLLGSGDRLTAAARDWLSREGIPILSPRDAAITRYRLLGGGYCEDKPEHMTHLHSDLLVPKNHPRIRFRGKLDTLEAELLALGRAYPHLQAPLGELLDLTRRVLRWEVLGEPAQELTLCGLNQQELRRQSHFPQEYYGQPHFMPGFGDSPALLGLNRVRCAAREAELAAVDAFLDRDGQVSRQDLLQTLNRVSSMLYILMIREKTLLQKEGAHGPQSH